MDVNADHPALSEFAATSPEILDELRAFCGLVVKWNPTINIVARSTVEDIWERHVVDSAQVFRLAPIQARRWLDLGSGGGFPGLVVAILARRFRPDLSVHLVESDRRKAVFLREVCRQLGLRVQIEALRIEDLAEQEADVVSARALGSLQLLCEHASRHLRSGGVAIFHKGERAADEIVEARKKWAFDLTSEGSVTSAAAAILVLKDLRRV